MLTSPMTAHPHVDPDTGGLAFFGYDVFGPPFLRYHELDAAGRPRPLDRRRAARGPP